MVYIDEVADNDDDNTEYLASQHELILSSVMSLAGPTELEEQGGASVPKYLYLVFLRCPSKLISPL